MPFKAKRIVPVKESGGKRYTMGASKSTNGEKNTRVNHVFCAGAVLLAIQRSRDEEVI